MDSKKGNKPLKGVVCDVVNCVYHDGDCNCTATQIEVGPMHAVSCTDTVCATFKPYPEGYINRSM